MTSQLIPPPPRAAKRLKNRLRDKTKSRRLLETGGSKRTHSHLSHRTTQSSKVACKSPHLTFQLLERNSFALQSISRQQLSLASDFPTSNLLVRNPAGEPARSLYLTNDLVRAVFSANDYKRIRIISAGTKIFTRQEGGFGRSSDATEDKVTRFRLLSEGMQVVLPYVKPESIVDADVPALRRFLEAYYPLLSAFDDAFRCEVGDKRACVLPALCSAAF